MSNVEIRPTENVDVTYVAANMRAADRKEVWATHRQLPFDALKTAISLSDNCYTAWIDERPVAIFGAYETTIGQHASPWLLGTDETHSAPVFLMKWTRAYLGHLMVDSSVLRNTVHAENAASIRYLKAAGFSLGEPYKNQFGASVIDFEMRR